MVFCSFTYLLSRPTLGAHLLGPRPPRPRLALVQRLPATSSSGPTPARPYSRSSARPYSRPALLPLVRPALLPPGPTPARPPGPTPARPYSRSSARPYSRSVKKKAAPYIYGAAHA